MQQTGPIFARQKFVTEIVSPENTNLEEFESVLKNRINPEIPAGADGIDQLTVHHRLFKLESGGSQRYIVLAFGDGAQLFPVG
jgi:hypothetical protein